MRTEKHYDIKHNDIKQKIFKKYMSSSEFSINIKITHILTSQKTAMKKVVFDKDLKIEENVVGKKI